MTFNRERWIISCSVERRGFGSRRGVPDIIVWIRGISPYYRARWRLPILIEYEGSFSNGLVDIQKFAERSFDEKIIVPVLCGAVMLNKLNLWLKVEYNVHETPLEALGLTLAATEHDVYVVTKKWSENYQKYVSVVEDNMRTHLGALNWIKIRINIFNQTVHCRFPILYTNSKNVANLIKNSIEKISIQIPGIIVTRTFRDRSLIRTYNTMFIAKYITML